MKHTMMTLLLSVLLAACGSRQQNEALPLPVEIARVESATAGVLTTYPGVVEAQNSSDLSFRQSGKVERILVKEGEPVRKGQEIARMDARDYRLQLDATEAEYRQVKAECERIIALHAEQAVSDNNYDKAVAGLKQITAKLEHHKAQLEDCVLTAPYDGRIGKVYGEPGEMTIPGKPMVSMISNGELEVLISLPEKEYLQRDHISGFTATFHALPGQSFPLSLRSISAKAYAGQLYQARLLLPKIPVELTSGMTLVVNVHHSLQGDNRLKLPVGSLCEVEGASYVYLYDAESGTVRRCPVRAESMTADGFALITPLSDQIRVGVSIVSGGARVLNDGQAVKPVPEPSLRIN